LPIFPGVFPASSVRAMLKEAAEDTKDPPKRQVWGAASASLSYN